MTRVVRIHSDLRWSLTSIYGLKRENAKYTLLRCYTIWTTRCGFVNVVFGFAARKVSRHQLHKHVNAHVYLGVLAYYAKQRPSRCWDPHDHVDKPFAWHNFRIPRFGKSKLDLANRDIMLFRLWKHIFTFTLISCTVKVAFGCGWHRQV